MLVESLLEGLDKRVDRDRSEHADARGLSRPLRLGRERCGEDAGDSRDEGSPADHCRRERDALPLFSPRRSQTPDAVTPLTRRTVLMDGSRDRRGPALTAGSSGRAPYTPPSSFLTGREKGGSRRENKATRDSGRGLADQRTAECRALGGSREECPGRQENGGEGSRESCLPE